MRSVGEPPVCATAITTPQHVRDRPGRRIRPRNATTAAATAAGAGTTAKRGGVFRGVGGLGMAALGGGGGGGLGLGLLIGLLAASIRQVEVRFCSTAGALRCIS